MKAIRLHLKQNSANYRREETVNCRMTYPLPPYSTVIGALHKACGYTNYHPMQLSIQGNFGSLTRKLFTEDCFLNGIQNDRYYLVKMVDPNIRCSAHSKVALALKPTGNNFEEGITIKVLNKELMEEYRKLRKWNKKKSDINTMSKEDYNNTYSKFTNLAKVPKRYEILCDVELIIHIVSDEQTMQDVLDNACNLISIGRGEDLVEIVDACETELKCAEEQFINDKYHAYIPCSIIENNNEALKPIEDNEGITTGGTKYLLNKDYALCGEPGKQQRIFNKVPVLYTSRYSLYGKVSGGYVDICDNDVYAVCLA